MRRLALIAAATLIALGVGACSSGSGTTNGSTSVSATSSATFPADWPTDIPAPTDLTLRSVTTQSVAGRDSTTAIYQGSADVVPIVNGLAKELKAAGYTETNTVANPPALIVSNWAKAQSRLGMNASSTGGLTLVTMTYSST